MFKVGLIGCGKISAGHLRAFETIDDAKITAACDLVEENLNRVCEKTGAVAYTDYKEMVEKGIECNFDDIKADIAYRDEQDSNRPVAPLKPAEDSVIFDNSNHNFEESVEYLYQLIKGKI